jgi:hypothetical protein
MEYALTSEDLLRENLFGLIKALIIMSGIAFVAVAGFSNLNQRLNRGSQTIASHRPIASIAYTGITYPAIGHNATPLITLPTQVNDITQDVTYLVDTGAVITALPVHYAKTASLDLSQLNRIILSSLTSKTVYGYVSTASLAAGTETITLPVTFAAIDTPVLGRQGFLDHYTLIFNHGSQSLTISTH